MPKWVSVGRNHYVNLDHVLTVKQEYRLYAPGSKKAYEVNKLYGLDGEYLGETGAIAELLDAGPAHFVTAPPGYAALDVQPADGDYPTWIGDEPIIAFRMCGADGAVPMTMNGEAKVVRCPDGKVIEPLNQEWASVADYVAHVEKEAKATAKAKAAKQEEQSA
jgi:hypothetical protein